MEPYEGLSDLLSNSIRYGLSNKNALIKLGIIYLVPMLIYIAGIVIAIFIRDNIANAAIRIISYIPMLFVAILLQGYDRRCLSGIFAGNTEAPDAGDLVKMIIDGIKIFVISLESMVIIFILCILPLLLLLAIPRSSPSGILGLECLCCLLYPVLLMVILLVNGINTVQWAVFVDKGSLLTALNPLHAIGLIIKDFRYALVALVAIVILAIMTGVISAFMVLLVVTILLLPMATIAFNIAMMYILARFYQHATGRSTMPPSPSPPSTPPSMSTP